MTESLLRPEEVVIGPGDTWFGGEGMRVRTLLGSCVAITLWHPRARIGGMCHFVVPSRGSRRPASEAEDGRYADEALMLLRRSVERVCTTLGDYEARLYGGGNQFGSHVGAGARVPERNVEAAHTLARRHGLRLVTSDVGGHGAREIVLDLATGEVTLRRVGSAQARSPRVDSATGGPRARRPPPPVPTPEP